MSAWGTRLIGAVLGAVFVAALMRDARWDTLLVAGWVALVLGALASMLYHHRRMGAIHELETVTSGGWRRVNQFLPWPKACIYCGMSVHDWKAVRAHGDPAGSPCAAHVAPAAGPLPVPAAELAGAGIDTLTDDEGQAAGLPPGRAEAWEGMAGLIERTTGRGAEG